jgi:hypothetical protein
VDTRRSYYLACRQDDFAEAPGDARALDSCEILYATPANDNSLTQVRLWARCWNLFRRLVTAPLSGKPRSCARVGWLNEVL